MPVTLEQYASYLDSRTDLCWPAPPEVERPSAKPYLKRLPQVRAVTWSVYGTLLAIADGQLYFEHPTKFIFDLALDKTLQEFKMWGSMSRKPGQPAEYLGQIYAAVLAEQKLALLPDEKLPGVAAERLWEAIIKRLLQKDYHFNTGFFGSLNEFSRKVAYFFHASLQGTAPYPGLAEALRQVAGRGLVQGLLADGQCFTAVQLQRGLARQDPAASLDRLVNPALHVLSYEQHCQKPSLRLFRAMVKLLEERGIAPGQVLHVGSDMQGDIIPARRLGFCTALFAGDKASLHATLKQVRDPATRPDILLTELNQVAEVVG
jgi:FMN phosphatase YigB (HAD superfamily)